MGNTAQRYIRQRGFAPGRKEKKMKKKNELARRKISIVTVHYRRRIWFRLERDGAALTPQLFPTMRSAVEWIYEFVLS
jgi:hypothetical protein